MAQVSNLVFTKVDRSILQSYTLLLDGLVAYLGDGYEMVLHSLEDLDHSVIKIVNGHYTGRKVGAPITDLALQMLAKIQLQDDTNQICYFTQNKKGEPLKATTICIRGENERIIGLLCINFSLNTPFSKVLSAFQPTQLVETPMVENFGESTPEMIAQAVSLAQERVAQDDSINLSLKNRAVVEQLYAQGLFSIKSAVEQVAQALSISKNTVYLHLRNCREKNG